MMKVKVFASLMLAGLPFILAAQSNDDLYFVPKKKTETKKETVVAPKQNSQGTTVYSTSTTSTPVVVKDVAGNMRDVDEYNRRYTSRENTFSMQNDTLYIQEKPYGERGEWVNGFEGSQDDYEYAMRIVRFRSPRYAIPVSSPLYWDVVYGAFPSWDWNVYDDGLYAYVFPTYSNPLWWAVEVQESGKEVTCTGRPSVPSDWVLLPGNARRRYVEAIATQEKLRDEAEQSAFNRLAGQEGMAEKGIVACGIGYNYVMETYPEGCPYPLLKISQYPLPVETLTRLADSCKEILVVEDGQPFVEEQLKGILPSKYVVKGRLSGELPRTGELTPDNVRQALGLSCEPVYAAAQNVAPRPPALCKFRYEQQSCL